MLAAAQDAQSQREEKHAAAISAMQKKLDAAVAEVQRVRDYTVNVLRDRDQEIARLQQGTVSSDQPAADEELLLPPVTAVPARTGSSAAESQDIDVAAALLHTYAPKRSLAEDTFIEVNDVYYCYGPYAEEAPDLS